MRLFITNLVVAGLLAFSASTASAITFTAGGADGSDVGPPGNAQGNPDQISITVTLDTEANVGITLWSIGVLFDDTRLAFNQGASSTASYALYATGKGNNFMTAVASCGGYPAGGGGCTEVLPGQINIDHVNVSLTTGTGANNTTANASIPNSLLATLVFDVLPEAASGPATIEISQTATGNVVGTAGGGTITAGLFGSGSVNVVPEPGVAVLMVAAIMTAGGLRARERRRS